MSLMEDIENILLNYRHDREVFSCQAADKIIKLIEKRIDEMIKIAYKNDPVSVWPLTQVKEMLK